MKALGIAATVLASITIVPAFSQDADARTFAVEGTCEHLIIAGQDLSAQCSPALVQILERGIVDVFVSTAATDVSGVVEPERMAIFRGRAKDGGPAWTNHDVEFVLLGTQTDDALQTIDVSGTCTYEDPADGVAEIACEAKDRSGRVYSLKYRTDGLPPVAF